MENEGSTRISSNFTVGCSDCAKEQESRTKVETCPKCGAEWVCDYYLITLKAI